MSVLYGTFLSDHIPVTVEINLQLVLDIEHGTFNNVRCKIDWSSQSKKNLYEYGVQTEYYWERLKHQLMFYCVKTAAVLR